MHAVAVGGGGGGRDLAGGGGSDSGGDSRIKERKREREHNSKRHSPLHTSFIFFSLSLDFLLGISLIPFFLPFLPLTPSI